MPLVGLARMQSKQFSVPIPFQEVIESLHEPGLALRVVLGDVLPEPSQFPTRRVWSKGSLSARPHGPKPQPPFSLVNSVSFGSARSRQGREADP